MIALLIGNDQRIRVSGVAKLDATGVETIQNDAVVEVTIFDREGIPLSGFTWPLTLSSEGNEGNYSSIINTSFITEEMLTHAKLDITLSDGSVLSGYEPVEIKNRPINTVPTAWNWRQW